MTDVGVRSSLYRLLPEVYRHRDAALGEPLRALLAVLDGEMQLVEDDVAQLYDDWFIETCEEWVVPYIGDLLGVRGLHPVAGSAFSQRARVANAISSRRRKGTAAALEQLAQDVTGWPARAVEFFERLATTQHVNHVRPGRGGTVDLRDVDGLELLGGPFERAAHSLEVRRIAGDRGRYNVPNVGLFLWRLQQYPLVRASARSVPGPADGRFTFDPLGADAPLFNQPGPQLHVAELAGETHVPAPLRRRPLSLELDARRQALVDGTTAKEVYFGADPVLRVHLRSGSTWTEIAPERILVCNLGDLPDTGSGVGWRRPPASRDYVRTLDGAVVAMPITVAVDPVLGRIAFPAGVTPGSADVEVSWSYGFSGDVGAGPYDRRAAVLRWTEDPERPVTFQVGVTRARRQDGTAVADGTTVVATVTAALQQWNAHVAALAGSPGAAPPVGVIALMDSRSYSESLAGVLPVVIPAGGRLHLVAGDWPEHAALPGGGTRRTGEVSATGTRPHLRMPLRIRGTPPASGAANEERGMLVVNGILLEGRLTVEAGDLGALHLEHTTIEPGTSSLVVEAGTGTADQNDQLRLVLSGSITGRLTLAESVAALEVHESIVHQGTGLAIRGAAGADSPGVPTVIRASTIHGGVRARTLEAENSIFTERVIVARRQTGCIRFCYLARRSLVPRRFRCLSNEGAAGMRVVPEFTDVAFARPAYMQLAAHGAPELHTGADDEGELGAFHFLQQTQRLANLRASLGEYLRLGLEAGAILVT